MILRSLSWIGLALFLFTTCTKTKTVTIYSSPGSAKVYTGETELGITPYFAKLKYEKGFTPQFTLKMEGYLDTLIRIPYEPKNVNLVQVPLRKKEVVEINLVSFIPVQTRYGVKLERQIHKVLAYLEVIERSPNVRSVTRVTNNEDALAQIGEPVHSPTDKVILYSAYYEEAGLSYANLWLQQIGGVGRTRITFGNSIDLYPGFTHDGDYIYFSSNRLREKPGIWRIRTQGGGGLTAVTNGDAEDFGVSVFPGNDLVAYTSIPYSAVEPQIWTIFSNGTLPTQLREGRFPQVSPNGKQILYVRDELSTLVQRPYFTFNPSQIWVMNADGISETQLTQNMDYLVMQPKWSPDGQWIAYASDEGKDARGNHNFDIWMMRSDGTRKTQLTTNGSWDDNPEWSPDGKRIYFRSNRGGVWNIWYFEPTLW